MAKKKSELQLAFENYNSRFFNGELFDVEVKWSKGKKLTFQKDFVDGVQVEYDTPYKPQEIIIARYLKKSPWMWQLTLIHEMAHLKLSMLDCHGQHDHGVEFDNEMLRLAKLGAFNGIW